MKKTFPILISALLGAIGGGILMMVATKAIPTMISKTMASMMQNMKAQMQACGCKPAEI